MANLVVRNLDEAIVQALKERAARQKRSAEAEHRAILEQALLQQHQGRRGQEHETVLVALGIADVNASAASVHVAPLQAQARAEAKAEAVKGE